MQAYNLTIIVNNKEVHTVEEKNNYIHLILNYIHFLVVLFKIEHSVN